MVPPCDSKSAADKARAALDAGFGSGNADDLPMLELLLRFELRLELR
eukprot:CAMPEP_0194547142 /NCGR_PEP_ID=MMETSP0253-20130528/91719_1 /TAXON_ID=2966 /ORGANISM="Noctiluca scintillans" /LENGTH=46 /DNA_ID= /DNA_START= /DNA_END= /DNA_ORIENTATION=